MDDASGEQWDRDMREIRAGRVVNADSDQWIVYRDMVDRAVKAEAEVKRLQEANMELQKTDNHYADECVMLKREIELREIEREDMLKSIERLQSDKPVRPRKLTAVLRDVPSSTWKNTPHDDEFLEWYFCHIGERIPVVKVPEDDGYVWNHFGECRIEAEWLEDIREEWVLQKGEVVMGRKGESHWYLGWYDKPGHIYVVREVDSGEFGDGWYVDEIRPIKEV